MSTSTSRCICEVEIMTVFSLHHLQALLDVGYSFACLDVAKIAGFVCLSVCLSHKWVLQTRLNWSRCHLGGEGGRLARTQRTMYCIRWVMYCQLNDPCLVAMQAFANSTVTTCLSLTLMKVKTLTGSVAELNCRLQTSSCQLEALQQELEQKQTSICCLQTKYDAERVCVFICYCCEFDSYSCRRADVKGPPSRPREFQVNEETMREVGDIPGFGSLLWVSFNAVTLFVEWQEGCLVYNNLCHPQMLLSQVAFNKNQWQSHWMYKEIKSNITEH